MVALLSCAIAIQKAIFTLHEDFNIKNTNCYTLLVALISGLS